jgi:hypothetical protein
MRVICKFLAKIWSAIANLCYYLLGHQNVCRLQVLVEKKNINFGFCRSLAKLFLLNLLLLLLLFLLFIIIF